MTDEQKKRIEDCAIKVRIATRTVEEKLRAQNTAVEDRHRAESELELARFKYRSACDELVEI